MFYIKPTNFTIRNNNVRTFIRLVTVTTFVIGMDDLLYLVEKNVCDFNFDFNFHLKCLNQSDHLNAKFNGKLCIS